MNYKGNDIVNNNNLEELKNYFNPYEYNFDNSTKNVVKENIEYKHTCNIEEKAK